ncbi:helix-turn-helix domain-containing protein [Streptomyces caelestis]|uniref:helix-turn-helix domain-containing protein n=1 Tax=Streptomyces caelestis TaxID=36816 RepID=UPI0036FED1D2
MVSHADLGALALLAEVPSDAVRGNADVTAVARLTDAPEDLRTLEAYCATSSLRRAADLLHLHHSSVARRLELIGKILGFERTEPAGLLRAGLALTAGACWTAEDRARAPRQDAPPPFRRAPLPRLCHKRPLPVTGVPCPRPFRHSRPSGPVR